MRTDHKAESLSIEVGRLAHNANTADGRGIIAGLDALRHATLYAAEQQRIANELRAAELMVDKPWLRSEIERLGLAND